ncbi:hypothetical protein GQ53DRAFT_763305 [Thozetella sp. PMI_491]|nr:hypothetical protein GQ53DRAFT_763305 [Thozetella sp. PMI_491]
MEEPQPMDYVLHSSDASSSRTQTQHSPPASCPSWRPDQTSTLPPALPNPNPDSTSARFRTLQPHPPHSAVHPAYDPVHASSNTWYHQQTPSFQWPTSIGHPPHPGYHSRNSSSDYYTLGGSGAVSNPGPTLGAASGPPHQQPAPPTLPFPDHAYGFPYPFRHTPITRFPPAQPPYLPFNNQDRSLPPQPTLRGISLPSLNPHSAHLPIPNPSPPHPASNNQPGQGAMSSPEGSSPSTPGGPSNHTDAPAESPASPNRTSEDGPSSSAATSHAPALSRLNPLPANAPSPTTPPVFATSSESGYRRQHSSRPRMPRPSVNSDYDSEEELERIEDEQMRFIEHYSLSSAAGGAAFQLQDRGVRAHQLIRGQLSNKRVASKKALASLESVELSTLPENERTCVICYNEFGVENPEGINEAPLRLPHCKHVFGDHCIKKWFEESDSCPYCRDKVPSEMVLPSSATLQAFLRASYSANAGRLTISGPRPTGRQSGSRSQDSEPYSRMRDDDLGLNPPRAWHAGERRSPPSEFSENRRRTRARHFRSASGAGASSNRPLSFGGQATATSSQHSPGRERVTPPSVFGQPSYPFANDPRRSLTGLFGRQFAYPPRPYNFINTPNSGTNNGHVEYGNMPFPAPHPENMMPYGRGMIPQAPFYGSDPNMMPNPFVGGGPPRAGPNVGWGQDQQPSLAPQPAPSNQPLPPLTGYEPSGHPRPYPNNNWQ